MAIEKYLDKEPAINRLSFVADSADLIGEVEIGKNVSIWHNTVLRADINYIRIGDFSNVQDGTVIHVDEDLPVIIGNHVTIGHNATIHACTIEDNCLIGMGAIILDGAIIESGCIIGAGSLIPPGKVIPANSLVMGCPGKIVSQIEGDRVAGNVIHAAKYWQLALTYLNQKSGENEN